METLCVTGHRPEGLPWKRQYDNTGRRGDYLAELKSVLLFCINHGFRHFISGGAIGVDTDFAFAVLELKNKYPIALEIAVPCPDQSKFWTKQEKADYDEILARADKVTLFSPYYTAYCMQKRNMYMVDKSDLVLAIWNGAEHGGTWNTIAYTRRVGKPLCFLLLNEIGSVAVCAKNGKRR